MVERNLIFSSCREFSKGSKTTKTTRKGSNVSTERHIKIVSIFEFSK